MTTITGGNGDDLLIGTTAGELRRVSTNAQGGSTNGQSADPIFSADGLMIGFESRASNITPGNNTPFNEVYVKNLVTGEVTLASASAAGAIGDVGSLIGMFSPDGTKVVFASGAHNLVPGDNGSDWWDIYVKDLTTGAVQLVSANAAGVQGGGTPFDANSFDPVFSPDGTKVAFDSGAANLTPADTNAGYDVFIKDLSSGSVTLVSTTATGAGAHGPSFAPVFSPDGSKVAFVSNADNLVPGDTNGFRDIFVKDLATGAVTLVSADAAGNQAGNDSRLPVFSQDGLKIAFETAAFNLLPGDNHVGTRVLVKDLVTGSLTLVSSDALGDPGDNSSYHPAFSPDGTMIAFESRATNLVPGDTNGPYGVDIFVKNLIDGSITRVSTDSSGQEGDADSLTPVFSPDGSGIAFASSSFRASPNTYIQDIFIKTINDGSDQLAGGAGNDTLAGAGGPDSLDGGAGVDTATYSGDRASYLITTAPSGTTTVQDLRPGSPDGTDTLTNIEFLKFADQTVDLQPHNQAPTAVGDSASTTYGTAVVLSASSLLANDTDPDGDLLSLTSVGAALHGAVSLSGGKVTFTPSFGYVGAASFNYTISDGAGGSAVATVTVTVTSTSGSSTGPAYIYGAGQAGGRTFDVSGDGIGHLVLATSFDDALYGGGQKDVLNASGGDDLVFAGAGDDLITGGAGSDSLHGESGRDSFIWKVADVTNSAPGTQDEIFDFEGAGDGRTSGDYLVFQGFSAGSGLALVSQSAADPNLYTYALTDAATGASQLIVIHSLDGAALAKGDFLFM